MVVSKECVVSVASSVVGLVYIYSRHQYFVGYGSSAQER